MGGLAVKTAASFDDSMRQVQAVTGATGDQFDMLRATGYDLGVRILLGQRHRGKWAMRYLGMAPDSQRSVYEATPQIVASGVRRVGLWILPPAKLTLHQRIICVFLRACTLCISTSGRYADTYRASPIAECSVIHKAPGDIVFEIECAVCPSI